MQKTNKQIKTKKQVTSYNILYTVLSTSRTLGNNKSELKQTWGRAYRLEMSMWNDRLFRLSLYEYILCQALIKAIPRELSLRFFTDQFMFRLLTLFFCFIIKQQQKLSLFFTQKRMAVETENQENGLDRDGEAGEVNSILKCLVWSKK